MPDLDLYPCASLREALGVWQAATRADPEAPGLTELAVLAGYAPCSMTSSISNARSRTIWPGQSRSGPPMA